MARRTAAPCVALVALVRGKPRCNPLALCGGLSGSLLLSVPRLTCRCKSGCTSMQFSLWTSCTDACNYCHMLDCCRLSFREVCGQQYGGAGVRHGVHPVSAAAVAGPCLYTAGIAGPPGSDRWCGNRGMPRWRGVGDRGAGAHGVAECHLALSGGETFGVWDRPAAEGHRGSGFDGGQLPLSPAAGRSLLRCEAVPAIASVHAWH